MSLRQRAAAINAVAAIDKVMPGFGNEVVKRLKIKKMGLGNNGLGNWIDDITEFFDDDPIIMPGDAEFVGPLRPEDVISQENSEDFSVSEFIDTALTTIQEVVPAVVEYQQQREWSKIQLERAQRGLPPIRTENYGAPPIVVRVDAEKGSLTRAAGLSPDDLNKIILAGAVVVGLYFITK